MAIHADTAVTVEFTHSSYNVSELERMLQVCASINVEVEVNVSMNIQSQDVTAQGMCALLYLLCNNYSCACDLCVICSPLIHGMRQYHAREFYSKFTWPLTITSILRFT
jgi:hypothetical protein